MSRIMLGHFWDFRIAKEYFYRLPNEWEEASKDHLQPGISTIGIPHEHSLTMGSMHGLPDTIVQWYRINSWLFRVFSV